MRFRQDRPLEKKSLGGYLLLIQDELQAHLSTSGDGWLLPEGDPYKRDWPGSYSGTALRLISWLIGVCKGFYFIATSSPLPVSEGEAHLTYGIMSDALKGEKFFLCSSNRVLNCLRTGLFDIMYLGALDVGPLPFGCYCQIKNDKMDLVGNAIIWAAPGTVEDA